jgi:hypothetical protein
MGICLAAVEQALRTNATDFGVAPRAVKLKPQHLFLTHELTTPHQKEYFNCEGKRHVAWVINGDGTVTNNEDRLMWIQAPWRMQWEGGSVFSGEPCPLSWPYATQLFGRGLPVELSESGTNALSASQIGSTSASAGYSRGACRITFAGYDDWRLPTVAEWHTVIGLEWGKSQDIFPRWKSDRGYWTANGRHEPGLEKTPDFMLRWLKRERNPIAWRGEQNRVFDANAPAQHLVMFVRTL